MWKWIHPVAGAVVLVTISTFWLSTVVSELFGSAALVAEVKSTVLWSFLLLIPALALTGGSGLSLAKGRKAGLVGAKLKRMRFIAGNGLLLLVPSAVFLAARANAGQFDASFYGVQALELAAGATNIALLGLNLRDGLRMTARLRRRPARSPAASPAELRGGQ